MVLDNIISVPWKWPIELVLVDDCSNDKSWELLQQWLAEKKEKLFNMGFEFKIFRHSINQGKGVAIQKAISLSTGAVLIVQDGDREYCPSEIPVLVDPILESKADVVFGSRFRQNVSQAHRTYHYLGNNFLTALSNLASGLYLTDMETCYKAFRRDIIENIKLTSKRFGFEPEVTAHLARLKIIVWELPISYYPRSYIEGKKITWKDGVAALWHILYFNFLCPKHERFLSSLPKKYLPKSWPMNPKVACAT
jgi:glycosyltransferase involved in cell wall biosynthesis